jgi:hypothetical protein
MFKRKSKTKKEKLSAYEEQLAAEKALENIQAAGFRRMHIRETLQDAKPETFALHGMQCVLPCSPKWLVLCSVLEVS